MHVGNSQDMREDVLADWQLVGTMTGNKFNEVVDGPGKRRSAGDAFGVQSTRRRETDFTRGKPIHYILVGLLVTVIFILTVWGVVKLVLSLAGV